MKSAWSRQPNTPRHVLQTKLLEPGRGTALPPPAPCKIRQFEEHPWCLGLVLGEQPAWRHRHARSFLCQGLNEEWREAGTPPAGRQLHLGECKLVCVLIGSSWNGTTTTTPPPTHTPPGNEIKVQGWAGGWVLSCPWVLPGKGCWWGEVLLSLVRHLRQGGCFGQGMSEPEAGYSPALHWEPPQLLLGGAEAWHELS